MTATQNRFHDLMVAGILHAIAAGKTIQVRHKVPTAIWRDWEGEIPLLFNEESWEVRVKPEPRRFWILHHAIPEMVKNGWLLEAEPDFRATAFHQVVEEQ